MSRKALIIAVALGVGLGTALCVRLAWTTTPAAAPSAVRDVTDMTRRTVSLPARPQRVLSLCSSATDTIVRLGAVGRLVAIDAYGRIVPGAESATVIGRGSAISREEVIALGIDLAFVWWYQHDAAEMLEQLSVPVVRIRSARAGEVPGMIRLVGRCLGLSKAAGHLADDVATGLAEASVGGLSARPRVYLELYGPFKTAGSGTYANDLVELAGGKNIAAEASGSMLMSAERLIQADPDVILFVDEFTSEAAFSRRGGMAGCSAVRAGRIRPIKRYWLVAGAGLPQAVEELRATIGRPADQER